MVIFCDPSPYFWTSLKSENKNNDNNNKKLWQKQNNNNYEGSRRVIARGCYRGLALGQARLWNIVKKLHNYHKDIKIDNNDLNNHREADQVTA